MSSKWDKERDDFVKGVANLFKNVSKKSDRSVASSNRERNPDSVTKRMKTQVLEYLENNLPWETPEDWDNSLRILGSNRIRRWSSYILSRMTWNEFVDKMRKIL